MKKHINILYSILLAVVLVSCEGFLDEKPNKDIVIPNSLEAMEAILDNSGTFNNDPAIPLIASDDYFTTSNGLLVYTPWQRSVHLWEPEPFEAEEMLTEWAFPYKQVFLANVVLDELEKGDFAPSARINTIRGGAHFFRAVAIFNLAQVFAPPYIGGSSDGTAYLPLPQNPNINAEHPWGSVSEIYDSILKDLELAAHLLPESSQYPSRPTRAAANAMLARVYLAMGEYGAALEQAEEVMENGRYALMDYNNINVSATLPFSQFNQEVIFHSTMLSYSFQSSQLTMVDSTTYNSYSENDLRKQAYYVIRPTGNVNFKGNYSGNFNFFSGLALDEVYLIRAECLARTGSIQEAQTVLNELLAKRWISNTFEALVLEDGESVLSTILLERRKSLLFRGLRWQDLRRLNKESQFQTTLKRMIDGEEFELEPNSSKYVFPVPPRELSFN